MSFNDTRSDHATPALSDSAQGLLTALEKDWRRMCGNADAPAAGRLDPAALDAALPYTFVLQRTAAGAARIRVAGRELHNMLRMEPRGMPFTVFFQDSAKDTVMEMVEAAFTLPAIVAIPLMSPRRFNRRPLQAQLLLLPMHDANGDLSRLMGAIIPADLGHRSGQRFAIDPQAEMRCETLEGSFPDRRTGSRAPQNTDERTERPKLRLVVDNG